MNRLGFAAALSGALFFAGCATAPKPDLGDRVERDRIWELENELLDKERRIAELEAENAVLRAARAAPSAPAARAESSIVRAAGVILSDVQAALERAGFDPGPADGKPGPKTRSAVVAFQKSKGLKEDGIVGERTWSLLKP